MKISSEPLERKNKQVAKPLFCPSRNLVNGSLGRRLGLRVQPGGSHKNEGPWPSMCGCLDIRFSSSSKAAS